MAGVRCGRPRASVSGGFSASPATGTSTPPTLAAVGTRFPGTPSGRFPSGAGDLPHVSGSQRLIVIRRLPLGLAPPVGGGPRLGVVPRAGVARCSGIGRFLAAVPLASRASTASPSTAASTPATSLPWLSVVILRGFRIRVAGLRSGRFGFERRLRAGIEGVVLESRAVRRLIEGSPRSPPPAAGLPITGTVGVPGRGFLQGVDLVEQAVGRERSAHVGIGFGPQVFRSLAPAATPPPSTATAPSPTLAIVVRRPLLAAASVFGCRTLLMGCLGAAGPRLSLGRGLTAFPRRTGGPLRTARGSSWRLTRRDRATRPRGVEPEKLLFIRRKSLWGQRPASNIRLSCQRSPRSRHGRS